MAGFGPPPSKHRRHRNKDTFAGHEVTVAEGEVVEAPPLPFAGRYSPATEEWYATWCRSPQAAAFTATDWQRLHMIAPLVDQYWQDPSPKLMAEIRLNESLLGATHVDRLRGRIKIEKRRPASEESDPDKVTRLDDYRELYGG